MCVSISLVASLIPCVSIGSLWCASLRFFSCVFCRSFLAALPSFLCVSLLSSLLLSRLLCFLAMLLYFSRCFFTALHCALLCSLSALCAPVSALRSALSAALSSALSSALLSPRQKINGREQGRGNGRDVALSDGRDTLHDGATGGGVVARGGARLPRVDDADGESAQSTGEPPNEGQPTHRGTAAKAQQTRERTEQRGADKSIPCRGCAANGTSARRGRPSWAA